MKIFNLWAKVILRGLLEYGMGIMLESLENKRYTWDSEQIFENNFRTLEVQDLHISIKCQILWILGKGMIKLTIYTYLIVNLNCTYHENYYEHRLGIKSSEPKCTKKIAWLFSIEVAIVTSKNLEFE